MKQGRVVKALWLEGLSKCGKLSVLEWGHVVSTGELELEAVIGFKGTVTQGLLLHPDNQHLIFPLGASLRLSNRWKARVSPKIEQSRLVFRALKLLFCVLSVCSLLLGRMGTTCPLA
eukprot:5738790-Amphidinium_carterae.1